MYMYMCVYIYIYTHTILDLLVGGLEQPVVQELDLLEISLSLYIYICI